MKYPKTIAHKFHITKGGEKESLIIDSLSKENTCSTSDTNCKVNMQCYMPKLKCSNFENNHLMKYCPKPKKRGTETPHHLNRTHSVRTNINTNDHIPVDIWQNINKQSKILMLDNKKITKYVQN